MGPATPFPAARIAARSHVLRRAPGRLAGLGLGALVVVVLSVLSLALGAKDLDVPSVIRAFTAPDGSSAQLIVTSCGCRGP